MNISSILRPRTIVAVALALIMSSVAYGFAASNSIGDTNAGDGDGDISGYTVLATDVAYGLNATNPDKLDTVTFTLTPDNAGVTPSLVKVQLLSGGDWYTASNGGTGDVWTIGDPTALDVAVSTVTTLRIVARD
ncbi:hypothetical protein K2Z83_08225 [Oscillochloris sp. ZM17-4]|uniref:hypothetical protein n=1 Tax=Oscillochloris sp. ZM17-4 TaxID=2866714 RepID=UPI001C73AF68|nr:hypothetical protein [Oscillochloris sp. ZM17-4]MBX0327662.1 hypothetical protein [Oscillochloris sp. ZM17-4]